MASSLVGGTEVGKTSLVLSSEAIKGLFENQREDMKRNVAFANEAWNTSGAAMRACAAHLWEIRKNCKNRNWTALINGGDLHFSASIAKDLISAHQWLSGAKIPDRFLANVSARTLGTVSRLKDQDLRAKITEKIISREGTGFSEGELKKILKEGNIKKQKELKISRKMELGKDASKQEVMRYYEEKLFAITSKFKSTEVELKKLTVKNNQLSSQVAAYRNDLEDFEDKLSVIISKKDNWLHQAIDATSNGSFTHRILRNIQSKQDKEFM